LLKLLWPGVAQPVFAAALGGRAEQAVAAPAIDPATFVPPLLRLRSPGVPDELLHFAPPAVGEDNPPLALDEHEEGRGLEVSVGTLVHRALQLVAEQGLAKWSAERVRGLEKAWPQWLAGQGHGREAAASGAAQAVAALCRTLTSETGRWVLAAHDQAGAEQAWSSRDENAAVNHVIDRIFCADGCRWIIDYKTVRLADGEGIETLRVRAESFRPQLERYAALFAGETLPLRLAIYFPIQGELLELP
jgi:ATP-dependent exoDNAse (exonuclease V) beta subunit